MVIAVSPYHLTTREVPAMAALLLGERVVTMLPVPVEGTGGLAGMSALQTAARIPTYRRFVESWSWTTPLWKREVLTFAFASQNSVQEMWAAAQHIEDEPACASLRHFLRHHDYPDNATYLSAVAADLLKGGPDPGISLPVVVGLDRFATRHALAVARSRAHSLAQQAEVRMGDTLATIAVPILLQATSERLMHFRDVLAGELSALRAAMVRLADPDAMPTSGDVAALESAAHALSDATNGRTDELMMGHIDDEVRAIPGVATITAMRLPWDAAITSSVRAMHTLAPAPAHIDARTSTPDAALQSTATTTAILPHDGLRGKTFLGLVIKTMGSQIRR